ncbi:MAG: dihydrofolate reductase family protein [Pseudobdellovibrionaceae bacterium]
MRKIVGGIFQSLDGVMQAPGGPTEDPTGGFEFGGWSTTFWDDKMNAALSKVFNDPFDLLLGRKTYEIFAAYWPFAPEDDPIRIAFTKSAKYVLTHHDEPLEWQNSHRITNIEGVKNLKASEGPDLLIQGSTTIYPQLLTENLIDRLFVMTFPIVLGKGKKLFGAGTPPCAMKLVSSDVSSTGVIIATYEPAGKIPLGSFQQNNPSPAEIRRQERMKREG